jgi:hypothetical protein
MWLTTFVKDLLHLLYSSQQTEPLGNAACELGLHTPEYVRLNELLSDPSLVLQHLP